MMRLFHSPTTPFGRKVMVLLLEAGLERQVEVVAVSGNPLDPGTMPVDRNPLGKIPALELADGRTLYDSRVICRYLDTVFETGLYPAAPLLWDTLTLEAMADGITDAAVGMAYEIRLRPADKQFPDWVEAQWRKIARALDAAEKQWLPHLAGPVDMAQVALACALGYLDFRHAARNWRGGRPGLAAWEADFAGRSSMQASRPPAA